MAVEKEICLPMSEQEELYLFEEDEAIASKYDYEPSQGGKWILFYKLTDMDKMWNRACREYRQHKLVGISSLKCSTAKYNPRTTEHNRGVIIFHCGPSEDRELMLSYGKVIVNLLKYNNKKGSIIFKTDVQSALGTRKTGNTSNSIYHLSVPKSWTSGTSTLRNNFRETSLNRSPMNYNWRTGNKLEETAPSTVTHSYCITEKKDSIYDKYACERHRSGQWMMFYNQRCLDQAWKKALTLYRASELHGVHSMKVSTAKVNPNEPRRNRNEGVIICYCGPLDDLEKVKSDGENLARLMEYTSDSEKMCYRVERVTLCSVDVPSCLQRRAKEPKDQDLFLINRLQI